ncbi:MAG: glycosyltransferase N-terminal domain-containing protein [Pseudomonadota bacterium]
MAPQSPGDAGNGGKVGGKAHTTLLAYRLAGGVLSGFIRLVRATSTFKTDPANFAAHYEEPWPFIGAMWHGQFMMLPYVNPNQLPVEIVLARHADAELMGVALESFGYQLIRGAGGGSRGKDRGGTQALRAALSALKRGKMVGMVCEVPPGPAREVAPGIIVMAKLSGMPIKPVASATSRAFSLNTWSRFTINLPFSRFAFALGDPIYVPRDADEAMIEAKRVELQAALDEATSRAYALCGGDENARKPRHLLPAPEPGILLAGYRRAAEAAKPLAARLLKRRVTRGKERADRLGERRGETNAPRPDAPLIWVHAASVGETNAALSLIAALRVQDTKRRFLLTTGTVTSAAEARKGLGEGDVHQFLPLDAPSYVQRFLDHWRPDTAVLVESEIWPNLILETAARGIPIALVNARISAKSFKTWQRRPHSAHVLFGRLSFVGAQDERMRLRFLQLGAPNVATLGNIKADAGPPPADRAQVDALDAQVACRPLWLAASTHPGEEAIAGEVHRTLAERHGNLLTIIVPRHPERGASVRAELEAQGLTVAQRSLGQPITPATDVYLGDTLGELGIFYALSPVAWIGGSLVEAGGHNPIEAIGHDCAIITGPKIFNFRNEFKVLEGVKGAVRVADGAGLAAAISHMLAHPQVRERQTVAATKALATLAGGLDRTVAQLTPLLPVPSDEAGAARREPGIPDAS